MEVRNEKFVGAAREEETMAEAYEDAVAEFETFGLINGIDFKIDPSGSVKGYVKETGDLEYLFKTELLTEKSIEKLRYEYHWFK